VKPPQSPIRNGRAAAMLLVSVAIVAGGIGAAPAHAVSDHVIISEAYGGGGNSGATYTHDFVELYNPTATAVDLAGYSVNYYSAGGNLGNSCALSGSIQAGGYFLVQQAKGAGGTTPLPTPDITCSAAMSGSAGIVRLLAPDSSTIDLVGYGSSATQFETAPAPGTSSVTSVARAVLDDTDDNSVDFAAGDPTPRASADSGGPDPEPEPGPEAVTIAEIQGTGAESPLRGDAVTTLGLVTAAYPTGGLRGFFMQTPGSGGSSDATPGASDGIFVYGTTDVEIGSCYTVAATVSEYQDLTELTSATITSATDCDPVEATALASLPSQSESEALEGMLVAPRGTYTIANNYNLNTYGTLGLAFGDEPLYQATDVVEPGAAAEAYELANQANSIVLDDGSSWNYMQNAEAQASPLPYLSQDEPMRTGSQVTFVQPVVMDYRYGAWTYQPVGQIIGATDSDDPLATENDREAEPPSVGSDLTMASFNVLNYFTELGADEDEVKSCDYYADRNGDPVATDYCEVRGAWSPAAFDDQRAKLVNAVNSLGAGVVALSEIETSNMVSWIDRGRDYTLSEFVDELNAAGGNWAYAASPLVTPSDEDIIRTAFIYDPSIVQPTGASEILLDDAFANARYPLAQTWQVADSPTSFTTIANHFKSKSSGEDDGTGQGLSNASRVAQAQALVDWVAGEGSGSADEAIFLMGDFNSYSRESPVQVIESAGFTDVIGQFDPGSSTYQYSGRLGSLDHVFANEQALALVSGAGVWDINADESIAMQYSRRNYNVVDFYTTSPFASSDHDPVVVGLDVGDDQTGDQTPGGEQLSGGTPDGATPDGTTDAGDVTTPTASQTPVAQRPGKLPSTGAAGTAMALIGLVVAALTATVAIRMVVRVR